MRCGAFVATAMAAAILSTAASGGDDAAPGAFVGVWSGHTRTLTIDRSGIARESISDGCCDRVIRLTSRLSHARRKGSSLVATATVVRVRVYDRSAFPAGHRPPRVGDRGRFTLRRGIIFEGLTSTTYCNARTSRLGKCGA